MKKGSQRDFNIHKIVTITGKRETRTGNDDCAFTADHDADPDRRRRYREALNGQETKENTSL
jgi:hypothetical protein